MNIGQLMRNLLGDMPAADSRALELKIGQIVRGVILQLMDERDALVNINGVPVRATLEAPLQPGQSAMLQVQPESTGGAIVLKPVETGQQAVPEETLKELLKGMGLPEGRKWAAELVLSLRRDGFALGREAEKAFQQAAASQPAGVSDEMWMQAAATAYKRGLPMTQATVAALHQAMFGKPAHELLATLQSQLQAFAGGGGAAAGARGADGTPRGALPPAVMRAAAVLAEGAALLRAPGGLAAAGDGGGEATAAQGTGAGSNAGAQPAGGAAGAPAAQPGAWPQALLRWLGAGHERQVLFAAGGAAPAGDGDGAAAEAGPPAGGGTSNAEPRQAAGEPAEARRMLQGQQPGAARPEGAPMPQALRQELAAAAPDRGPGAAGQPPLAGLPDAGKEAAAAPPGGQESLKSALLSLAASDDVPPALRETAQQLVQQITGQQLLLSQERSGVLLSHVTLFVPFQGGDGDGGTAAVHVQARRSGKGELDAENCRLLFDLSMKRLGDTVVDVQVVEKIVSLNIWNDHPMIGALVDGSRQEIRDALGRAGYQLSSLNTKRMPEPAAAGAGKEQAAAAQPPALAQFVPKRHKGVDFRV